MKDEQNGLDLVPTPTKQDRYAEYREMNKPEEQVGKPELKAEKVDKPADEKNKSDEASNQEQEPKHKPDWLKKINSQTSEIKSLKARLAELDAERELSKAKVEIPKYNKENFASEAEYIEYLAENKARELFEKERESFTKQQKQELEAQEKAQEWNKSWANTVQDNYKNDPEGLKAFVQKLQDPELTANFSDEIHEYIGNAPLGFGARLLDALTARPDLVDRVNRAHPSLRPAILYDLEKELKALLTAKPNLATQQVSDQPKQKPISSAPAPIGGINPSGNVVDESDKDNQAYDRYMKKRFR